MAIVASLLDQVNAPSVASEGETSAEKLTLSPTFSIRVVALNETTAFVASACVSSVDELPIVSVVSSLPVSVGSTSFIHETADKQKDKQRNNESKRINLVFIAVS